jgi:hypothetical protein
MPGFDVHLSGPACHDGETGWAPSRPKPSNTVETARRHRFKFEVLEPLDKELLLVYAYKATRPSVEIEQIVVHNGQDEIYRPGKHKWRPIDITFYERVFGEIFEGPNMSFGYDQPAELINQWWASTMINLQTSLHGGPSTYRKPCQLDMLDGLGNSIWVYYLANCWPMKVEPSDLSYADAEIADITVTLSYDKAIEKRV